MRATTTPVLAASSLLIPLIGTSGAFRYVPLGGQAGLRAAARSAVTSLSTVSSSVSNLTLAGPTSIPIGHQVLYMLAPLSKPLYLVMQLEIAVWKMLSEVALLKVVGQVAHGVIRLMMVTMIMKTI